MADSAKRLWTYPRDWDEPYEPPASLKGELREAMIAACERTLAMTPPQKQAMFDAQRESFIRAMSTPCEHGELDFEQCGECFAELPEPPKVDG